MSIPVSNLVQINPAVLSGGGAALALAGLMLTNSTAIPINTVQSFNSQAAVAAFFGAGSTEASLASNYFSGYDNSTVKPGNLLMAQYPSTAVAAYMRGGSLAAMTLAQLQALNGILTVTVDGVPKTSSAINLSTATSFSDAATKIQAGFTAPNFVVSYDAQRAGFVFTSNTTGNASSATVASGTLSAGLNLTTATGAVVSPGAAATTPAAAMDNIATLTQNWAAFTTTFEPVIADKLAFAAWTSGKNNRFAYVGWDTDATNATNGANAAGFGAQVATAGYSGVMPIYGGAQYAAFVLGTAASIDFTRRNGRITFAYKSQSGLVANVTDSTAAANLAANGYNLYGQYASPGNSASFLAPGSISGPFKWADTYFNEIQLSSAFQAALIALLTGTPSIPYNPDGKNMVESALIGPINAALDFGSIRENVALSAAQAAQVNTAAGTQIDSVLSSRGWYLQVKDAPANVRAARGSFPLTFWYMDGGSVHNFNMASIAIQ
jgi:hypothetical protein